MLKLNCLKLKLLLDYLWLEMEGPGQISVYMQFHKQGGVTKSLEHPNMHRMRNTKKINHCSQSQKRKLMELVQSFHPMMSNKDLNLFLHLAHSQNSEHQPITGAGAGQHHTPYMRKPCNSEKMTRSHYLNQTTI